MTREQQRQLKAIDDSILQAAFVLQNLIRDRAVIDPQGTKEFAKGIGKILVDVCNHAKKTADRK